MLTDPSHPGAYVLHGGCVPNSEFHMGAKRVLKGLRVLEDPAGSTWHTMSVTKELVPEVWAELNNLITGMILQLAILGSC